MLIAVIGSASCSEDIAAQAREVGRELARRGAILVCGGRGGVMAAACQGAKAMGGLTVGVLPGADRSEANPDVDVAIATGLGEARNAIVVRAADAVIAVSGGYGTLSEIGLALKMGKPVIGLGTWRLDHTTQAVEAIIEAQAPVDAVELAVAKSAALAADADTAQEGGKLR
jgi:uncharacterized protein (TIGR00725 family)